MEQEQHTPLPWRIYKARQHFYVHGPETRVAAIRYCGNSDTGFTTESDAVFIVRACNSHYELLDDLKSIGGRLLSMSVQGNSE
jgi:hypothetical protein